MDEHLERAARRGYTHADEGELLDVAVRAITVFEELSDDLGLARAWRRVASCHENACRLRAAEEACDHALVHARRAGSTQEEARTIDRLCTVFVLGPAPAELAIARCESFLARPATPLLEANVVAPLAVLRAMTGDLDEARRLYARGEAILEELGLGLALIGAAFLGGLVELLAAIASAAERHVRKGYDAMVEAGFDRIIPFQGALLAEALRRQDRQAEAARIARESSEAPSDDALGAILCRTALGYAELYDGHVTAAAELMHEADALADQTDALLFRGDTSLALAHALRTEGDLDGGAAAAQKAVGSADKGNRVAASRAERFLTGAAGGMSNPPQFSRKEEQCRRRPRERPQSRLPVAHGVPRRGSRVGTAKVATAAAKVAGTSSLGWLKWALPAALLSSASIGTYAWTARRHVAPISAPQVVDVRSQDALQTTMPSAAATGSIQSSYPLRPRPNQPRPDRQNRRPRSWPATTSGKSSRFCIRPTHSGVPAMPRMRSSSCTNMRIGIPTRSSSSDGR